jgi:hypothetical protein
MARHDRPPSEANPTTRGTLSLVSSSEPRLSRPAVSRSEREINELISGDMNPLKSTVPFTTHILLVGSMLLFFVAATLITLQASWEWWLIEVAIAIPVVTVIVGRWNKVQRLKAERRAMAGLAAPAQGRDR